MGKLVNDSSGFGAIESILILVIVAIVGFTGWYVWHAQQTSSKNYAPTTSGSPTFKKRSKSTASTGTTQTTNSSSSTPYLDVTEWGIRLSFADADKVTYSISTSSDGSQSTAELKLKPSVASVCQGLGVGVVRVGTYGELGASTKIGNFYYGISGGPGACSDDPGGINGSINQLRSKIDSQELGTGQYTLAAIN